jgi:hypothetical protein
MRALTIAPPILSRVNGLILATATPKSIRGMIELAARFFLTFGATCNADRDVEIAADGKDTAAAPKAATVGQLISRHGCDSERGKGFPGNQRAE